MLTISLANCQQTKPTYPPIREIVYTDYVKSFQQYDQNAYALTQVKVIDGTGSAPKENQTLLIKGDKILDIGSSDEINIPEGFVELNLRGKTVIPGIVGTHNHMRLPRVAMLYSSPKLYLASGVTTIQTCGTGNPFEEIEISQAIEKGYIPGPDIVNSGPYLTGPEGKTNFIRFTDEQTIRDTLRFWVNKGVEWFKVYRNTRPQDLKVIIDEAHKLGAKVSGHLCATTYQEAAELGIDAIEHGFIHSFDHAEDKEAGTCSGSRDFRSTLAIDSDEVRDVHQSLIDHKVALTSTLSIFETQARGQADQRSLDMMAPFNREAYKSWSERKKAKGADWYFKEDWLIKSMQYDLAFFRAGGLLTAGPDPGLHNLPGYGDQKNYELFIEAGFKPEEAIQVMTANGAKLLDRQDMGTIKPGMRANLVILEGDLSQDASNIQQVKWVFKNGKGYDPEKLTEIITGHLGDESDESMEYFGQKKPGLSPEVFAPNLISKPDLYEFGSVFSKDKTAFYYALANGGKSKILYSQLVHGVWTQPQVIISHEKYGYNDPMLSPDENRLYFISDQALDGKGDPKDHDIWYVEKEKDGWSAPINAGEHINTTKNEYYMSFTKQGTMYFSSNKEAEEGENHNFDIYKSSFVQGAFQPAIKLDSQVNTSAYEADVFVAPDESYLIFCGRKKEGFGQGDLYISFQKEDGSWTKAKNMGESINNEGHQLCPFVSMDGKYLFYTSKKEIYWVDAAIIEGYRE